MEFRKEFAEKSVSHTFVSDLISHSMKTMWAYDIFLAILSLGIWTNDNLAQNTRDFRMKPLLDCAKEILITLNQTYTRSIQKFSILAIDNKLALPPYAILQFRSKTCNFMMVSLLVYFVQTLTYKYVYYTKLLYFILIYL